MVEIEETDYKGVVVGRFMGYQMVELNTTKNVINNDLEYINKISIFAEYVGYLRPKYVIFNKIENDFEISSKLYKFSQKEIIHRIFEYGVKKIFFLVNDSRYELYNGNISAEDVYVFKNHDDLIRYIETL